MAVGELVPVDHHHRLRWPTGGFRFVPGDLHLPPPVFVALLDRGQLHRLAGLDDQRRPCGTERTAERDELGRIIGLGRRAAGPIGGHPGEESCVGFGHGAERLRHRRTQLGNDQSIDDRRIGAIPPARQERRDGRANLLIALPLQLHPGPDNRVGRRGAANPARDAIEEPLEEVVLVGEARGAVVGLAGRRASGLEEIVGGVGDGRSRPAPADGVFMGRHGGLQFGELGVEGIGLRAGRGRPDDRQFGRNLARGEDPVEAVIVRRTDRFVFVIVTAATGDCQPQQSAGDQVDAIVDDVVGIAEESAADSEKTERGQVGLLRRGLDQIGSELERHEPVVGHVGGECPHDPVAVGPGEGIAGILVAEGIAHRVGVAGQIEPVPRPVFGVLRRRQEFRDKRSPSFLGGIRGEGIDTVGRRGKAGEVKPQPADEGPRIGLWRRLEARGDDLRGHEAVE